MDGADAVEVLGVVAGAGEHQVVAAALGSGEMRLATWRRGWRRGGRLLVSWGRLPTGLDVTGGPLDVSHARSGDFLSWTGVLQGVH